jgi:hypothetical protein
MKRDMDLIREILIEVEKLGPEGGEVGVEGRSTEEIAYHTEIMKEAGLLKEATDDWVDRMTWQGHEFLDAARSLGTWKKTMLRVGGAVGSATLETIMTVLADEAKRKLGLS